MEIKVPYYTFPEDMSKKEKIAFLSFLAFMDLTGVAIIAMLIYLAI